MDDESNASVAILNEKYKYQMVRTDPKSHTLVEIWEVIRVDSEKNANMKIEMITQKIPLPKIATYGVTSPMSLSVASAVLTKDVAMGEELLLYAPVQKRGRQAWAQHGVQADCRAKARKESARHVVYVHQVSFISELNLNE